MDLSVECIEFLQNKYKEADTILQDELYMKLKNYPRHKYTNTYDHSVRVAVGAAIIAMWLHTDVESAIRVGLLHDMCYVNYYERNDHKGLYAFYHPVEAAENADKEFGLSETEKSAIKSHMFPLAVRIPTSRLALALTLSDKAIAMYEGLYGISIFRNTLYRIGRRARLANAY
jgi:uncharacterized protein